MAVAAMLERSYPQLSMATQAELVGRVVIQLDETRRPIVAIAAGEIPAVIDVVEGNVAVIGFEGIGTFCDDRTG